MRAIALMINVFIFRLLFGVFAIAAFLSMTLPFAIPVPVIVGALIAVTVVFLWKIFNLLLLWKKLPISSEIGTLVKHFFNLGAICTLAAVCLFPSVGVSAAAVTFFALAGFTFLIYTFLSNSRLIWWHNDAKAGITMYSKGWVIFTVISLALAGVYLIVPAMASVTILSGLPIIPFIIGAMLFAVSVKSTLVSHLIITEFLETNQEIGFFTEAEADYILFPLLNQRDYWFFKPKNKPESAITPQSPSHIDPT